MTLVTGEGRPYPGSTDSIIWIWDPSTLECIFTLIGHTSFILSLLIWNECLVSSSLEQTIKVWAYTEIGVIGIINDRSEEHGVLALTGMNDAHDCPVLFCALDDHTLRLFNFPSFRKRGEDFCKEQSQVHTCKCKCAC